MSLSVGSGWKAEIRAQDAGWPGTQQRVSANAKKVVEVRAGSKFRFDAFGFRSRARASSRSAKGFSPQSRIAAPQRLSLYVRTCYPTRWWQPAKQQIRSSLPLIGTGAFLQKASVTTNIQNRRCPRRHRTPKK